MSSILEPEIQFAQKLASNEKPIRTRALKKLRKYISVRSQKETGGFTDDELLKLWKGLFYCLWMQDKPLLQEKLSTQISSLIHSFQNLDGQLLFLESFMKTFKREWTGIDRLRMDKFYQLVRFVFRQTFEMLKRNNWGSSMVGRFLEVLTAQLLQNDSQAPIGLLFHVLDIYMTELALVGSSELTANQTLMFIEPFCRMAAKTKDQTLFSATCSGIFSTIIDQAPFAIEDLMKEVNAEDYSDSGHSSEDENVHVKETTGKPADLNMAEKHLIGNDDNIEYPDDDDIGPVLQFDYAALAEKLLEFASRSNTPGQNRKKLYKIIKVLRDLSEGIFPRDDYPEEVSTDEDDDMFGSRKRMKKIKLCVNNDEEEAPPAKKSKGDKKSIKKKKESKKETQKDDGEQMDQTTGQKEKNRRKTKRIKRLPMRNTEENFEPGPDTKTLELQKTSVTVKPEMSLEVNTPPSDRKNRKSLKAKKKLKSQSPKSESKTVTFGLNNNKTAEFRKTDRSLLVSPEGSSRVPFDPEQKPRFGVLKSSPTPVSTEKPTHNTNQKTSLKSKKSTLQKRPLAADFF